MMAAAGTNGTAIIDVPASSYNLATSFTGSGENSGCDQLPTGITIQCAAGASFKSSNSNVQFAFWTSNNNSNILGCTFNGIGIGIGIGFASNHQITGLNWSNDIVQNVFNANADAGITIFGILRGSFFNNNVINGVWQGGACGHDFNCLFGSAFCQNATNGNDRCDHQGHAISIVGYVDTTQINNNTMSTCGNDCLLIDVQPGGYSNAFHISGGGNVQIKNNNISLCQRFGIEMGGFAPAYDPPMNFSIPIMTNLTVTGNWVHNVPGGFWLIDGYSVVMNGAENMTFENNTMSNETASPTFGTYADGNPFEIAANLWTMRNNVSTTVRTTAPFDIGATFLQGNADAFSAQASGVVPKLTASNNYFCGIAQMGTYGTDGPQWTPCPGGLCSNSNNGFSPVTRTADAVSTGACRNAANVSQSLITPLFTSANGQTVTTGTLNVSNSVQSNLSVRIGNWYVDGGSTPVASQELADTNPSFSLSNLTWLYHASVSTSGLSNGAHTISFVATDVSGATATSTQNFTVGGATCSIIFQTLPAGTVGAPYGPVSISATGCGASTWTITPGSIPAGLTTTGAGTATLTISGTPTTVQMSTFTLNYSTATPVVFSINIGPMVVCNSTAQNTTNGLYSDTFGNGCLAPVWTFQPGQTAGTATVNGSGLSLAIPSSSIGSDAYSNGDQSTEVLQNLQGNLNFNITATSSTLPTASYQGEGLKARQDQWNFVRCEGLANSSGQLQAVMYLVTGTAAGTTPTPIFEGAWPTGNTAPLSIQMIKTGNTVTCNAATGAGAFVQIGTVTTSLNFTKVALAASTGVNGTTAPAWTASFTSFNVAGSSGGTGPPNTGNPWGQTPGTITIPGGSLNLLSTFIVPGQSISFTPVGVPGAFSLASGSVGTIQNISGIGYYTAPASINSQHVIGGCMVQPNDSIFNTRVDSLPLNANSAQWTNIVTTHIIDGQPLTAASAVPFSWQTPFALNLVDNSVPATTMTYFYSTAYNGSTLQIPPTPNMREGGTYATNGNVDHHVTTLNYRTCNFQETYQDGVPNGSCPTCKAQSGWQYQAMSYAQPVNGATDGGTSDAAGMPLMPTILTLSDLQRGVINHPLRASTAAGYINRTTNLWPATTANGGDNTFSAPFGARWRLKASVNPGGLNAYATIAITGFKQQGFFFSDIGTVDAFTVSSDLFLDPLAVQMMQQLSGILTPANFEVVDESGLQISAGSSEVPVANASGPAVQVIFTPTSGAAATTFPIALQGITVGTPFDSATIIAGEAAVQMPSWTNGDPSNAGVSWTLTACSTGTLVNCGAITTPGVYTPPASVTSGTFITATLKATSITDATQSKTLALKITPAATCSTASSCLYVDSGAATSYTDHLGNVWLLDMYGLQMEGGIFPFFSDLADSDDLWGQNAYNAGNTDLTLWKTGVGVNAGQSGSGDIYYGTVILPNGKYRLTQLFGLTGENGPPRTCWNSYSPTLSTPNFQAIGVLGLVTQGILQAHNWNYGIPAVNTCRTAVMQDLPVIVTNRFFNGTIATDANAFNQTFLNGYSLVPYTGTQQWFIDNQQITALKPGQSLQLYVRSYNSTIDPAWSIINGGPGSINPGGLYTAPASQAWTSPTVIQACSISAPSICATTNVTIIGSALVAY